MLRRAYNLAIFGIFLAALLVPASMYAAGQRAREFEGQRLSPLPNISAARVLDPEFYNELSAYFRDASPAREALVKAAAQLKLHATGEISGAQVLQGQEGWLFLTETIVRGCFDEAAIKPQVANLRKLSDAMTEAGIPLIFAVAPDKPSIYPEKLTPLMAAAGACWDRNRAAISRAMEDEGIQYWKGWQDLADSRYASDNLLYYREDTHWSQWGAFRFSTWIVQALAPELVPAPASQTGAEVLNPDLSRLAGLYGTINAPVVAFARPGEQGRTESELVNASNGQRLVRQVSSSTPDAALSGKRVLFLHDSFMHASWGQVSQYFKDTAYMHWSEFKPEGFVAMASVADAVVIEVVERNSYGSLQEFFSDGRMAVAFRNVPAEARAAALATWPPSR
jgi:hypothetical protein